MENMKELVSKSILLDKKRTMYINIFFFENGCFIMLSENSSRIGSLTIASSLSNKVTKAQIIPSKYDSLFIDSIAQRISLMLNGLCLVSLHNMSSLNIDDMKIIMGEILNIISERAKEDERK
jgi:hypothetical protein